MHTWCLTNTNRNAHTLPYAKAQVPQEKDFVNVNAIQWWQQAVSALKWALCWAECNDSQDNWSRIWNSFHFAVMGWGWLTGGLASRRTRALQGGVLSSLPMCVLPWKYISTPAFLFMPAPLSNAQGYWFCLNLSERSGSTFLVTPAFLASGIYLQKAGASRQSCML